MYRSSVKKRKVATKSSSVALPFSFIGLGNPGDRFQGTRHNVGFSFIQRLCQRVDQPLRKKLFRPLSTTGIFELSEGLLSQTILTTPLTYMNRSGEILPFLMRRYGIPREHNCIVVDNMDLPVGEVRMKRRGSAATHNGLRSISARLESDDYPRIYIGVGRPEKSVSTVDHVLGTFTSHQAERVESAIERVVSVVVSGEFSSIERLISAVNAVRSSESG